MILTVHQPTYLSWLGLFHKIALSDIYIYLDTVQYVEQDWISRNRIKTFKDSIFLTVPVFSKNRLNSTIADIKIKNNIPWAKKHTKTLLFNYQKSLYFKEYFPIFEAIYNQKWEYLADLNFQLLQAILFILGIKTIVKRAQECNFKGKKSDLILDICLQNAAKIYISGELGTDYIDIEKFQKNGVILVFQNYQHPIYNQCYGDFVSHLSVLDLIFNNGPKSLKILMSNNIKRSDINKMIGY